MCRMVGVVFKDDFPMEALADLRHISEIGKVPDQGDEPDGHRDGWGMISFDSGSPFYLGRSPRPIHVDPSFDSAKEGIRELERPNILICHARRGSEGETSMQNTHPFVRDGIVFAHNGSVKKYDPEIKHQPRGNTDSERVFMRFLDRFEELRDIPLALGSILEDDIRSHDFTGLIFMISDGKQLYGYREYGDGKDSDYYNLKYVSRGDCAIMFQEASSGLMEGAEQVANRELVCIDRSLVVQRRVID